MFLIMIPKIHFIQKCYLSPVLWECLTFMIHMVAWLYRILTEEHVTILLTKIWHWKQNIPKFLDFWFSYRGYVNFFFTKPKSEILSEFYPAFIIYSDPRMRCLVFRTVLRLAKVRLYYRPSSNISKIVNI